MTKFHLPLLTLGIFFAAILPSWAEEGQAPVIQASDVKQLSNAQWHQTIDAANEETQQLLSENEKLSGEYDLLKKKLEEVTASLDKLKQDVKDKEDKNTSLKDRQKEQQQTIKSLEESIDKKKKEIYDVDDKTENLKHKLSEAEHQNELWQLKVSDLQIQKRELMLDIKLQQANAQEQLGGDQPVIDELKAKLAALKKEEEPLLAEIDQQSAQQQKLPADIERIKQETRELEVQMSALEQQKEQQQKANDDLMKQNKTLAATAAKIPPELVKQRRDLETQVARQERELDSVKRTVSHSTEILDRKKVLMDEIMTMDSQNAVLREQITSLMSEVESLQKNVVDLDQQYTP